MFGRLSWDTQPRDHSVGHRELISCQSGQDYRVDTFRLATNMSPCLSLFERVKLQRPKQKHAHLIHHLEVVLDCYLPTTKTDLIHFDWTHAWGFVFPAGGSMTAPEHSGLDYMAELFMATRAEMRRDFCNLRSSNPSLTT